MYPLPSSWTLHRSAHAKSCAVRPEDKESCALCPQAAQAVQDRQTIHPEFLEMLACELLLEFLLERIDFELFLAQTGQVPILAS